MSSLKSLVIIRARHLAESITTPALLTDAGGNMVFFNEAAEPLIGARFADQGPMHVSDWQERFNVRARDGSKFPIEQMPGWLELQKEIPTLGHIRFSTPGGAERFIAVCGIPLFANRTQFEGALLLIWEEPE